MKKILIFLLLLYSLSLAISSGTLTFGVGGTYGSANGLAAAVAATSATLTGNVLYSRVGSDTESATCDESGINLDGYGRAINLNGGPIYFNIGNVHGLLIGAQTIYGNDTLENGEINMIGTGSGYALIASVGGPVPVIKNIHFRLHGKSFNAIRTYRSGLHRNESGIKSGA